MLGPGWGELVAFIRELVSLLCGGIYESLIAFPRCCLEPWVGPWLLASAPLAAALGEVGSGSSRTPFQSGIPNA